MIMIIIRMPLAKLCKLIMVVHRLIRSQQNFQTNKDITIKRVMVKEEEVAKRRKSRMGPKRKENINELKIKGSQITNL